MKIKFTQALILGLALSTQAHADLYFSAPKNYVTNLKMMDGGLVGNGGGTIVCRDKKYKIKSIELLDFYEARSQRNAQLDIQSLPGNWKQKAEAIVTRIGSKSEFRLKLYSEWLKRFESEEKMQANAEFSTVADSGYISVPKGCAFEQAAVQRRPNFTGESRYFINADLWDAMDDSQKAGLVLHEILYREAIGYGHTDSIRTRYLNALYASPAFEKLSTEDYEKTLIQAHYESTDRVVPDEIKGTVETTVKTERLWQAAPDEANVISSFILKDRVLVKLGECFEECKKFTRDFIPDELEPLNSNFAGIISKDVFSLRIGQTEIQENPGISELDDSGAVTNIDAMPLTDVVFVTHKIDGLSSYGTVFSPHKYFSILENGNDRREAHTVKKFAVIRENGKNWEWNSVEAQYVNSETSAFTERGVSFAKPLAYSDNLCVLPDVTYYHDHVSIISKNPSGDLKCKGTRENVRIAASTQFSNGVATASVLTKDFERFEYDPATPNVFFNLVRQYSGWNLKNQNMDCENHHGEMNCFVPVFTHDLVMQSFSVLGESARLSVNSNTLYDTGVKNAWAAKIKGGTQVSLYPSGNIKTFVIGEDHVLDIAGQIRNVTLGSTIELDAFGNAVSARL